MLPGLVKLYVPVRRFSAISIEHGNKSLNTLTLGGMIRRTRVAYVVESWKKAPVGNFYYTFVTK